MRTQKSPSSVAGRKVPNKVLVVFGLDPFSFLFFIGRKFYDVSSATLVWTDVTSQVRTSSVPVMERMTEMEYNRKCSPETARSEPSVDVCGKLFHEE